MMLATEDDVRMALRRELTESEVMWLNGLLDEASDQVVAYLHPWEIPMDPTPPPIVRVVAAMVAAVLSRPASILPDTQSLSADAYGVTFSAGANSRGPYLSEQFKDRLRPYKLLGGGGLVVVEMSSERGFTNVSETPHR